jgi:hypothetical protein
MNRSLAISTVTAIFVTLTVSGCTSTAKVHPSSSTSASPVVSASRTLNPDTAIPGDQPIWRQHAGPGTGPFESADDSAKKGSYKLQLACTGGLLEVEVSGAKSTTVNCATPVVSIPVCLKKNGLHVKATWAQPDVANDLVWQMINRPQGCASN